MDGEPDTWSPFGWRLTDFVHGHYRHSTDEIDHTGWRHIYWDEYFTALTFLDPGTWYLRVGFFHGVGTWPEMFNGMHTFSQYEFHVPEYDLPYPDPKTWIALDNVEEWKVWLPEADPVGASPGNELTLSFNISSEDPNQTYLFRLRLNSSRYPGRFTNDCSVLDDQGMAPSLNHDIVINPSWKNALTADEADLRLDDDENEDWNIEFRILENEGVAGVGWGVFSAVYDELVQDGDTVEITVSSYDYGGRSHFTGTLTEWGPQGYPQYPHDLPHFPYQDLYTRIAPPQIEFPLLPVPRDEELSIDTVLTKNGVEYYHSYGDGIGDQWEEQYVAAGKGHPSPSTGFADSLVYGNIKFLEPREDDSWASSDFFPEYNTPVDWGIYTNEHQYKQVKARGDGITNFEKYRGFYGVTDPSLTMINHVRLQPHIRHIFCIPFEHDTITTYYPDYSTVGDVGIFDDPEQIHLLKPELPRGSPYFSSEFHSMMDIGGFPAGPMFVNRVYAYPDTSRHQTVAAVYSVKTYGFNAYVTDYLRNIPSRVNLLTVHGVVRGYEATDWYLPKTTSFSYVNAENLETYFQNEPPAQIPGLVRTTVKLGVSHEMGHYIGMPHNIIDLNSIMNRQPDYNLPLLQSFKTYDYRFMQLAEPGIFQRHEIPEH